MKYLALIVLLLASSVVGARADTDHWTNTQKRRADTPDAALHGDSDYCRETVGPNLDGEPTPPAFKRCMALRGWRYQSTTVEKTWIDPETGLTCHDILGGFGSSCSNF